MSLRTIRLVGLLAVVLVTGAANASSFWFYLGSGVGRTPSWCHGHKPVWVVNPLWWNSGVWMGGSSWMMHIGSGVYHCGRPCGGWCSINKTCWQQSRDTFQGRLDRHQRDTPAWVGLALSQGTGGRDVLARRAMRKAVRQGIDRAVPGIPAGEVARPLARLEGRYTRLAARRGDHWFMVASLRTIRGDRVGAARAAELALLVNPRDAEARMLLNAARSGR